MKITKSNPEHYYYELIDKCRRRNTFSIETNVAAGFYFNEITRRINNKKRKKYRGRICLLAANSMERFLKNEPYKMFYKTCLDDSKFHVLDLSTKRARPKIYGNILNHFHYTPALDQ